jgi:hypothetical protein
MNIWRQQPSSRLCSRNLIPYQNTGASVSIAGEFFEVVTTYLGVLKRWTGSAWVKAKLYVYQGSWVQKALRIWTGLGWGEVDATG